MTVEIRCVVNGGPGSVMVDLAGEFDLDAEANVLEAVERLFADGATHVTFDLDDVDFIDSSGVRVLVRLRRDHGDRVGLGATSPSVRRVLDIAGVTGLFADADHGGTGES
jgi:anti-anti-sigma factor